MVLKRMGMTGLALVCAPIIAYGSIFYSQVRADLSLVERVRTMSHTQAIVEVKTAKQAESYVKFYLLYVDDKKNFGEEDYIASFKRIHEKGGDDCDGGALAAAALLSDNGYPPLMLCMHSKSDTLETLGGHAIFVYQENGKWGTIGIGVQDCKSPKYANVEEIVKAFGYDKYNLFNIAEQYPDWLDNNINMHEKLYRPDIAKVVK